MSLHEPVPEVDLTPTLVPPLGENLPRDILRLLHWYFYRPQALFNYDQLLRQRGDITARRVGMIEVPSWHSVRENSQVLDILLSGALGLVAIAVLATLVVTVAAAPGVYLAPIVVSAGLASILLTILVATISYVAIGLLFRTLISGFIVGATVALVLPQLLTMVYVVREPELDINLWFPIAISFLTAFAVGISASFYQAFMRSKSQNWEALFFTACAVALLCGFAYAVIDYRYHEKEWSFAENGLYGLVSLIMALAGALSGILRLDDWIIGSRQPTEPTTSPTALAGVPFVTPLPVRWVELRLDDWLDYNWKRGMANVWEVWVETRQQYLLSNLIAYKLKTFPANGKLISSIATISDWDQGCDWRLLFRHDPAHVTKFHYSPSQRTEIAAPTVPNTQQSSDKKEEETSPSIRRRNQVRRNRWMRKLTQPASTPLIHQAEAYEITGAAFYYLSRCYVSDAVNAFPRVSSTQKGQAEMVAIAKNMKAIWDIEEITKVPRVKLLEKPKDGQRKNTWDTFDDINEAVQLAWLFRECKASDPPPAPDTSLTDKEWCYQMCIQKLQNIRDQRIAANIEPRPKTVLPETERRFVERVIDDWTENLNLWHAQPPDRVPIDKFKNPFPFAEPLRDPSEKYLVGRDALVFEIDRAWKRGNFQTIVVTGQPFIGKTSLVLNSGRDADSKVTITWFKVGHIQRFESAVKQFLFALCSSVGVELDRMPPDAKVRQWNEDPYRMCEQYLQEVCHALDSQNLIVTVDDFDKLDELFVNTTELDACLDFLAHLHQSIDRLGFVFATRFPEYRFKRRTTNPFASASRFISVSYLGENESDPQKQLAPTKELLNGRLRKDGPRFRDETITRIHELTNGHPYLIALIGHTITQRFLKRLADREDPNPLFNLADLQAALDSRELRSYLHRYGQEVLSYLSVGIGSDYADAIRTLLWRIAQAPAGVAESIMVHEFVPITIGRRDELHDLLVQMEAYDIIEECEIDGNQGWRIEVELFRAWIAPLPR